MKPANFLAALVLVFAGIRFWEQGSGPRPPDAGPAPAVVVPADVAALVAPLAAFRTANAAKAAELAALYTQLARVIQRDAGQTVKSTGQFARLHRRLIQVAAVPPGGTIGPQIEQAIGQALGIASPGGEYEDVAFDAGKRQRLVDVCHGLAQVFGG